MKDYNLKLMDTKLKMITVLQRIILILQSLPGHIGYSGCKSSYGTKLARPVRSMLPPQELLRLYRHITQTDLLFLRSF